MTDELLGSYCFRTRMGSINHRNPAKIQNRPKDISNPSYDPFFGLSLKYHRTKGLARVATPERKAEKPNDRAAFSGVR